MATIKITPANMEFINHHAGRMLSDPAVDALGYRLADDGPMYELSRSELATLAMLVDQSITLLQSLQARQHPVLADLEPDADARNRRRASALFSLGSLGNRIADLLDDSEDNSARILNSGHCWRCAACGQRITTLLPVLTPPTCSSHTGGGRLMVADN